MSPTNESELLAAIIDLARMKGFMVCHIRPALTEHGWRTPISGHPGLPDVILARDGEVWLWEIKSKGQKPTEHQKRWIAAAGFHARLYYPSDWDEIVSILTAKRAA